MTIHPRRVSDNKNHGRFSRTQQFIYSVSTEGHASVQRAIIGLVRMEYKLSEWKLSSLLIKLMYITHDGLELCNYSIQRNNV